MILENVALNRIVFWITFPVLNIFLQNASLYPALVAQAQITLLLMALLAKVEEFVWLVYAGRYPSQLDISYGD